jgi:hypothetical protein
MSRLSNLSASGQLPDKRLLIAIGGVAVFGAAALGYTALSGGDGATVVVPHRAVQAVPRTATTPAPSASPTASTVDATLVGRDPFRSLIVNPALVPSASAGAAASSTGTDASSSSASTATGTTAGDGTTSTSTSTSASTATGSAQQSHTLTFNGGVAGVDGSSIAHLVVDGNALDVVAPAAGGSTVFGQVWALTALARTAGGAWNVTIKYGAGAPQVLAAGDRWVVTS